MVERLVRRLAGWTQALQDRGPARLLIHEPGQPQRQQTLLGGCYRVGRDPMVEIPLTHTAVSRQHALLEQHGAHWLLSDNGSTNGLWWQGGRVKRLLLRDGDSVRLGPSHQGGLPELTLVLGRRARLEPWLNGVGLVLAATVVVGGGLVGLSLGQVPIRGSLAAVRGPLVLYDGADRPLASADDRHHHELRRLQDYPPVLVNALLASEDSRFWWHPGVDPIGTGRALVANLLGGRVLEGGSTLTQQLARSLYPDQVGQGETLGRKWRELLVAMQLEARFSKHDLLLSYLNRVYLGAGWGFEDASRHFFAKPARGLQLEEAALLVGLLPSPNGFDPCVDPQAALAARNQVLAKMADSGPLSADQARAARRLPIRLAPEACRRGGRRMAPFYSDQVRRDLNALVGADVAAEGNFLIGTHLDGSLQERVERLLRDHLAAVRSAGVSEGAVVVLDSRSGGVLAVAGGRDYRQSQFNRATLALRQPGSTFKLMTYLTALERGARPGDSVGCGPLRWRGQVFASGCGGQVSLQQALAMSSNTAALRLAQRVGLEAVVQTARDLGITSPLAPVPGLVLGQSEVSLLELTAAYGAVANNGIWHAPSTIRRLTDAESCQKINDGVEGSRCRSQRDASRSTVSPGRRVVRPATAAAMRQLLQAVVRSGTGTAAYVGGEAGGKTGTTNEGRDLLFIGFEPQRHWVMGIWLGNDDNRPSHATSALAAALWGQIVRASPNN